jgi:hypothetical protein
MDLSLVIRQLRAVGARVEIPSDNDRRFDLLVDGQPVDVKSFHREPAPSDVKRALADAVRSESALLISTSRITPALAELAMSRPDVIVVGNGEVIRHQRLTTLDDNDQRVESRTTGPRPYARFAIGRALLATPPEASQRTLAAAAGVSQGAVSQGISAWRHLPRNDLFDALITEYPGPGGVDTFWWSDAPVREQGADVAQAGALISGDVAASSISPWRVPEHVIAYAKHPIDLSSFGYVLSTPTDYTSRVIVPKDPTLWATSAAFGRPGVADPVIAAWDVLRSATTGDADEAVGRLRTAVMDA